MERTCVLGSGGRGGGPGGGGDDGRYVRRCFLPLTCSFWSLDGYAGNLLDAATAWRSRHLGGGGGAGGDGGDGGGEGAEAHRDGGEGVEAVADHVGSPGSG